MKSCDFLSTLTTTYKLDKNVTSIKPEGVEEFDLLPVLNWLNQNINHTHNLI